MMGHHSYFSSTDDTYPRHVRLPPLLRLSKRIKYYQHDNILYVYTYIYIYIEGEEAEMGKCLDALRLIVNRGPVRYFPLQFAYYNKKI